MDSTQRMKIALTTSDKVFEFAIWFVLISLWTLTIWNFSNLPETIPYHFNASGQVDGFAKKESIFIMPSVISILIIGMKILGKFPRLSSYGKNIPAENYNQQLKLGSRIGRTIVLGLTILFFFITYEIIQIGIGKPSALGRWYIPLMVFVIFIPTIIIVFKIFKTNQT
jgi:uncharacterized membrane protein